MKEQAVQKINKIGKISSVVTLICKILVGMGMGILLLASVMCAFIPKDSIRFVSTEKMAVEVDYGKFGAELIEADVKKLLEDGVGELLVNGATMTEENIEVAGNLLHITQEGQQFALDIHDLSWMTFVLFVMLGLIMITLFFVGGLCKAFRDCQSPFEENVIQKMQRFAYSLIPWIVASSVIETIGNSITTGLQDIEVTINVGMILVVLIVFLLVSIFKYGAVLQQESDETL